MSTTTRTDWTERLRAACQNLAARTSKEVTASEMIFPASPIVVRVGDAIPYTFRTVREAALRVETWLESPL